MRYVIYGAGAVGGVIGARLHQHGHEVVLIARGAHLAAIRERGLTLRSPVETVTLQIPAVGSPAEVDWREDDVVMLTMKTQDTATALLELRDAAGDKVPVICVQNAIENERLALRFFANVYGTLVYMPSTFMEPGTVIVHSDPLSGALDSGRYPEGVDDLITKVTADLDGSTFSSHPIPDIMRWKREKLMANLNNALEAVIGVGVRSVDVNYMMLDEAHQCFEAAGLEWAEPDEVLARREGMKVHQIEGIVRGNSTWQSLQKGGSTESDYLNGEIVLLGRLHGVPTPVNALLQRLTAEMARDKTPPGAYTPDQLLAMIEQETEGSST
jgi:2-dehydropantoate 2-reductase